MKNLVYFLGFVIVGDALAGIGFFARAAWDTFLLGKSARDQVAEIEG